jgi:hypothetical protein
MVLNRGLPIRRSHVRDSVGVDPEVRQPILGSFRSCGFSAMFRDHPRIGWQPLFPTMLRLLALSGLLALASARADVHLFILSGQSNMAGLDPKISFTPTVEEKFGKENVIVVKSAQGGQPIRRWYKQWKPSDGPMPDKNGDLYDKLMDVVRPAIEGREVGTVTFVWMQGERDAKEGHADVYAESMKGLIAQLSKDLGRDDVNFVIGRLSDFDMKNARYPEWTKLREVQVAVAEGSPRGAWVDTDDLNDKPAKGGAGTRDDLHYTKEGYKVLGERFAKAAIDLIGRKH